MTIDFAAGVARFGGRRDRYMHHLREAMVSIPDALAQIREELDREDFPEAEQLTHALRGRVGTLGMTGLFGHLQELELAIRQRRNAGPCFDEVAGEIAKVGIDVAGLANGGGSMEWQDSYSVGVPEIDEQHRGLFRLVGELATQGDPSAAYIHELLSRLADYAKIHFESEERFLRTKGCQDLNRHVDEHSRFVGQVTTTSLDAMRGRVDQGKLLEFLHSWLLEHILAVDQPQLRQCLNDGGPVDGVC